MSSLSLVGSLAHHQQADRSRTGGALGGGASAVSVLETTERRMWGAGGRSPCLGQNPTIRLFRMVRSAGVMLQDLRRDARGRRR